MPIRHSVHNVQAVGSASSRLLASVNSLTRALTWTHRGVRTASGIRLLPGNLMRLRRFVTGQPLVSCVGANRRATVTVLISGSWAASPNWHVRFVPRCSRYLGVIDAEVSKEGYTLRSRRTRLDRRVFGAGLAHLSRMLMGWPRLACRPRHTRTSILVRSVGPTLITIPHFISSLY